MYNYSSPPPIPASIRLKRPPLIILNPRLIQELLVFVSPICAVMVLRLVADVLCGLVKISVIHREGSIARLPVETLVILFIQGLDPLAAVCLDAFHEIGQGDGLGQGGQDVDMIADATDFDRYATHIADKTADVGEHLSKVFIAYLHTVVLDVEDDVDVVLCK